MNIPNMLTLSRFILIPSFIYTFYFKSQNHFAIPIIIFILAGITDILDGYIARKYNMVTKWGKLLDPLADKFFQVSALFVLTDSKLIPAWIIIAIVIKEIFLIVGGGVLYKRKIIVQANWYGKLATILFYIAFIFVLFTDTIGVYFMIAAAIMSLYAAANYAVDYSKVNKLTY